MYAALLQNRTYNLLDLFFVRYLYESVWSKANEHQSGKLPHIQTVLVVTHSGVIRAFMSL